MCARDEYGATSHHSIQIVLTIIQQARTTEQYTTATTNLPLIQLVWHNSLIRTHHQQARQPSKWHTRAGKL